MNDVPRLLSAFESGALVRPDANELNAVDLARALARLCGVEGLPSAPGVDRIAALIGEPEHIVFVVVDGLGMNLVDRLPESSFLRRHLAASLLAVYPSTTAVGLTSYATALWPNRHAVTSWFVHLPEINSTAVILPFVRRSDGRPLQELGVTPEQAFPAPSLLSRYRRDPLTVAKSEIAHSVYSRYWAGYTAGRGYHESRFDDAVEIAMEHVQSARSATFTYLYLASVDDAQHHYGIDSPETRAQLDSLDRSLRRLAHSLSRDCRIVLSTDHGHLDVPQKGVHFVEPGGRLRKLLKAPPSGDARLMFFHVRHGVAEDFRDSFSRDYGETFVLLSTDEAELLELFGPGRIAPLTRARMGDFVAISLGADVIPYEKEADGFRFRSVHSGLTPQEMRIPLVVA